MPANGCRITTRSRKKSGEYQSLFQGDSQPALLRRLRLIAVDWMERLAPFNPYLTGAVLGGTAGEHSDVHLQVFCDNPKEVAIYFLNANIQYDVSETRHFAGRGYVETLSFLWRPQNEGRDAELAWHSRSRRKLKPMTRRRNCADARGRRRACGESCRRFRRCSTAAKSPLPLIRQTNNEHETDSGGRAGSNRRCG